MALETFIRFFVCPMTVTDDELASFLDFEVSHIASPPTTPDEHHFYFRSWKLTHKQLQKVISHMTNNEDTFCEIKKWEEILQLYANEKNAQAPNS